MRVLQVQVLCCIVSYYTVPNFSFMNYDRNTLFTHSYKVKDDASVDLTLSNCT